MIVPSYGLTATERVLPRLALDWTTGLAQSGVDVTRAGVATFVGSDGLIQSATADTQRVDWLTGTAGLLVEESRTNQILRSEFFSNSIPTYWGRVGVTAPYGITTAPDGTSNASEIIGDGTSTNGYLYNTVPYNTSASQVFTVSKFFKYKTRKYIQFEGGTSVNGFGVTVDLQNGVITATGSQGTGVYQGSSITSFGNGWYRVTVTGHCGATTNVGYWDVFLTDSPSYVSGVPTITASSASFYLWGAQLELGAFPTSYIPTFGSAVTRNADVATMTGTNFSDWYNPTESTFLISGYKGYVDAANRRILTTNGTNGYFFAAKQNTNILYVEAGAANIVMTQLTPITLNQQFTYVSAFKLNDCASSFAGISPITDTSGTMPTGITTMQLGASVGGSTPLNGHISKILYWPQRLTNAETQTFSKG